LCCVCKNVSNQIEKNMNRFIELYKQTRKKRYLKKSYATKYAFVGIGNHSINNLYPVLKYLNVPVKYIVTKSSATADVVGHQFKDVIGTNDFEMVLKDTDVANLFICANPQNHYELTMKALLNNKNVFVEKPPCTTMDELDKLIEASVKSNKTVLVGLQKRYSPCTAILKKKLEKSSIISYNYRYVTGNYPEGDEVLDLYIHPLDLISHLFGPFEIRSISNTNTDGKKNGSSVFLHLQHDGFIGNIEVSTNYMWTLCEESMLINTKSGIYKMENHDSLTFQKKQGTVFSIPIEKLSPNPVEITHLFHRNNFNPILNNNQLFTMGFYTELLNFVNLCEGRKAVNLTTLQELKPTFSLIEKIKNSHVQ